MTKIFKIDHWFAELMHKLYLALGKPATYTMRGISWLAEVGLLFILIGLILCIFKKSRRAGISILISLTIGVLVSNICLKLTICRERPFTHMGSDFFKWWLDAGSVSESSYSFPSGHTTATTAFAVALFLNTPKKKSWPVLILPVLMLCSRTYLMVHFFTDCIAGMGVGIIAGTVSHFLAKWIFTSKNRLFMFIQDFEFGKPIPKHQQKASKDKQSKSSATEQNELVYITQAEESKLTTPPADNSAGDQSSDDQSTMQK